MITITRKMAAWGCSLVLIGFIISLILAIKTSTTWLIIVSIISIVIYSIGLLITIYDYKTNG